MKNKLPTTWNLTDLGKKYNDPKFADERTLSNKKINVFSKKWKKDQSYLTDAKSLKKALDQFAGLSEVPDTEGTYLFLMRQVDSGNKKLLAAEKKYDEYTQELSNQIRFFGLSLGKIELKYQNDFLQNAGLEPYKHFLEGIFETARYQLTEPEEKILSLKSGVSADNWDSMVEEIFAHESAEVLVKNNSGKIAKETKTFNEIISLINHETKSIRDTAALAISDIFKKHAFVVEKEFNSILENKKINDELRGYVRPDQARILSDDISLDIVDTMSDVVTDHFKISHDYYALKAKILKQKKLHYHERNLSVAYSNKEYSYQDAAEIVHDSLMHIDPEFAAIHADLCNTGKIDVYPRSGKRGGAFCMYHAKSNPVYIMLNHTNETRDVMTLAHEMGHAIHGTLAKCENALNYDTPMFMAEIASTFCEGYTFDQIIAKATDKEKLALYMEKIGDGVSTISRQIAAYNFEKEVHKTFREKGYLPSTEIGKIFQKHMKSYMGSAVLQDYDSENWWMHWHHFRRPFYVYSYASGLLIANGMRAILKREPERWPDIKKFFYTGTSKSPQDVFAEMGIDIADPFFWEGGVMELKSLLAETKKLAKKLGKI